MAHMKVKELVAAAYAAAPELPPAAAELMRNIASRLDVTFRPYRSNGPKHCAGCSASNLKGLKTMAKNSIDVYGASGKTNVLVRTENLHLVTDKTHPLYDERVHLPIDEGMVLNIMELGVLEPIIVWKDPETGLTCVVVGRQRVKHTLEANKLV
jgi:hypothetical protein